MTSPMLPSGMSLSTPLHHTRVVRRTWDSSVPPSLRPLFRAYLLAYASVVAPKVVSLVAHRLARWYRDNGKTGAGRGPQTPFLLSLRRILADALHPQRFPAFCAALIGGSTWLKLPSKRIFNLLAESLSDVSRKRLARWCASFVAAWFSLRLLQSKTSASFTETVAIKSDSPPGVRPKTVKYAGRTLDLSLFAATRALDVIVGELWSRHRARRRAAGTWTEVESAISRLVDPAVFALSTGLVMWTWIYNSDRLPYTYDKWIASAAAVDFRLIQVLRRCRSGEMRYGEDTGQVPMLQGMCADYKWPLQWGDPAKTVPFPCEMVHMGCGPSCEIHAISRFGRSFLWAMRTYLPLNLLLIARSPNRKGVVKALLSAARSSAFLGACIALYYYGVCLGRTRLGPYVLGKETACRQKLDSGVCVGSGCVLCGWSILIEHAGRRKDMALFVAPRALATLLPRRYSLDKQWRETFLFAFSTAVVFTCIQENKQRVRGVFGNVLATVLNA